MYFDLIFMYEMIYFQAKQKAALCKLLENVERIILGSFNMLFS